MTWRIHHHWLDNPCRHGSGWARAYRLECPCDIGLGVADALRDAVTALTHRRGVGYDPAGGNGTWLWCIGSPDMLRDRAVGDVLAGQISCIDLHLAVCERHRAISLDVDGGDDLVADQPIDLGVDDVVDALVRHVESWLDSILVLPGRVR
jgi:hypothetical protein